MKVLIILSLLSSKPIYAAIECQYNFGLKEVTLPDVSKPTEFSKVENGIKYIVGLKDVVKFSEIENFISLSHQGRTITYPLVCTRDNK